MEIDFTSKKLAKQLTDPLEMVKSYGKDKAKRLKQRMEELRSVTSLAELRAFPQANCHELTGKSKGFLALDISRNWRLIFSPNHQPTPTKSDGGLDWEAVTKVLIESIEDYH